MNKSKYSRNVESVRNHKWEEGNVDPVTLPEETYGECKKPRCHNEGELGNGICQKCWDTGSDGRNRIRKRVSKKELAVPIIIISEANIIIS
jgi:hypothetical protein